MSKFSLCCRLLGGRSAVFTGVLALLVALLLIAGCTESATPQARQAVSVETAISDPVAASATDYAQAAVKPADAADAVATLATPEISATEGFTAMPVGPESQMLIDCGNTGTPTGSLPLFESDGRVTGDSIAVLPKGDSSIELSPDTTIDLNELTLAQTKGGVPGKLRIRSFRVLFSVHDGVPPTWTLPSRFKLDMEREKKMFVLDGSYLSLSWKKGLSTPPADGKVTLTVDLYDGSTKVAGPLTKTASVSDDVAIFSGNNNVQFNGVGITLDLRDAK